MNGIWNRSPAIILRLVLAFTLALLVGSMGGEMIISMVGCLSLKKTLLLASLIELDANRILCFLTWEGKVHFRGKYGEATVNVLHKISQVDFRPANTGTRPIRLQQ